jgi:hypothetical protein
MKLEEDLLDVRLDGSLGDEQTSCDRLVRQALGDEAQHFSLPLGQYTERVHPAATAERRETIVGSTTVSPSEIRRSASMRTATSKDPLLE